MIITGNMEPVLQRSSGIGAVFALIMCFALAAPAARAAENAADLAVSLAFAAAAGSPEEIGALVEKGAKPDTSANSAGVPALSLAVQRKDAQMEDMVKALLEHGANIEVPDARGQTPLFYAARTGNVKAIQLLLAQGADLYRTDSGKETARNLAFKNDHPQAVQAMDDFVKAQTTDVMKQYEARNQEIAQRNAEFAQRGEEMKERNAELDKQHAQIKQLLTQRAATDRTAKTPPAEAPPPPKPKAVDKVKLEETIHQLSYHACAVEYWRFCRSNKQDTGMSRDELRILIEAHDTLAGNAGERLVKEFGANEAYLAGIVDPTLAQITDELRLHATNANRKAEGIGSKPDMDNRCADIADQWELVDRRPGMRGIKPAGAAAPKPKPKQAGKAMQQPAKKPAQ